MSFPKRSLVILWTLVGLLGGCKEDGETKKVKHDPRVNEPWEGPKRFAKGEFADFMLLDHRGESHELYRYGDAKAVVVVAHAMDCPVGKENNSRLKRLSEEFGGKGVIFLFLDALPRDEREKLVAETEANGVDIPILMDKSQLVTKAFGFKRVAEVAVLETKDWKRIYQGSIGKNNLEKVLQQHLTGQPVTVKGESSAGCEIKLQESTVADYAKDIGPILTKKCVNCHSKGGRFPPYFTDYQTLAGWRAMIRETLLTGRMPPWRLDPKYGKFTNDISLSPQELRMFVDWLDAGAPRGEGKDPLVGYQVPPDQWTSGEPDYVAEMAEEIISPPEGTYEYGYEQLGGAVPHNLWVTAFRTVSTNPRIHHHQSMMVVPHPYSYYEEQAKEREKKRLARVGEEDVMPVLHFLHSIRDEAKGQNPRERVFYRIQNIAGGRPPLVPTPKNTAIFIPKGSYLIIETHYVPTGKEEREKTKIEFYTTRKTPWLHRLRSTVINFSRFRQGKDRDFTIPPGAKKVVIPGHEVTLKKDNYVVSFLAHMHLRGKAISLHAAYPDGSKEILVSIPNYYPDWEVGTDLRLVEPKRLPAGTRLRPICVYDNSATNPFNPDPSLAVHWGQTVETSEMCKVGYNFYLLPPRRGRRFGR